MNINAWLGSTDTLEFSWVWSVKDNNLYDAHPAVHGLPSSGRARKDLNGSETLRNCSQAHCRIEQTAVVHVKKRRKTRNKV